MSSPGIWLLLCAAVSPAAAADDLNLRYWDRTVYSADFYATLRPAYRFVEGFSDEIMDFTRFYIVGAVSEEPGAELKGYRDLDSFAVFERSFSRRQRAFLKSAPAQSWTISGPSAAARDNLWVGRQQARIAMAALQDTLRDRYRLANLHRWAAEYARDPSGWDPASFAAAGTIGAAFLYLSGVRASYDAGPLKLLLDVEPGYKLRAAAGGTGPAAAMEVRLSSQPLRLRAELGLEKGRMRADSYSLNFEQKF